MRLVDKVESLVFGYRKLILGAMLLTTFVMGFYATQLRMEAGFEKQFPVGHEYVKTFKQYETELFGANRLTIVLKVKEGSIWTVEGLRRLYDLTQAVQNLPSIDRYGVQSIWTPNSFVSEITEEGFRAEPLIGGTITPASLTPEIVEQIRKATIQGGFIGTLISKDGTSAMVTGELFETDSEGKKLDYVRYNDVLEEKIRNKFEGESYKVQITGFAKQVGEIAAGASNVLIFCGVSLFLTALAVYWYCHSFRFTILPIFCSLSSLVWQFGTLHLMGYGLDPLGVLVPFLVFAIGVSHGVQQINYIVRELAHGASVEKAARSSFSGLLIPGVLALFTAFVSFVTLILIPIPMVQELAITASIGVGYKIFTNLIMLPLAATFFSINDSYAARAMAKREARTRWIRHLAKVARPKPAFTVVLLTIVVFGLSVWNSRDRVIGTLQAGAPELRSTARFNQDAVAIADSYDVGLDWLSVIFEVPANSCTDSKYGLYQAMFSRHMRDVPGVISISSFSDQLRLFNSGYNEGYPAMNVVPLNPSTYGALGVDAGRVRGYVNMDCSMTAVHLYLTDHKATTIQRVIKEVKTFRDDYRLPGLTIRLAGGNAGILAAIDEEVEKSEFPMLGYVYVTIIILVLLAYRDWRAVIACCLPLTVGTFIGYWFMKELNIGLSVATLPVMVLAVGIGVDYAFYIYNRMQAHLAAGETISHSVEAALLEVGIATIFTAITLAIGVLTWSFSELQFQADMGNLLAFMFIVNLIMAMTALPALAVTLEKLCPRKMPVRESNLLAH